MVSRINDKLFLATETVFSTFFVYILFSFLVMWIPLILLHLVAMWLLIVRGWRWLGMVPLIGIILLIVRYYQRQQHLSLELQTQLYKVFQSYGISLAWTIFVFGMWQLLSILGVITYATGFWFLGIHLGVFLCAIFFQHKDIATISHRGWWMSGLLIIWQSLQFGDWSLVGDMVAMMISLSFALYACLVFVFGTIHKHLDRRFPALLFVFSQLLILVWVVYQRSSLTLWTVLGGQIYLGIMYAVIQRVRDTGGALHHSDDDEDLLEVILRGEKIQPYQERLDAIPVLSLRDLIKQTGQHIFMQLPGWVFTVLGALNLILMLVQLFLVLGGWTGETGGWIDIGMWISIAVYVINYFVLQGQRIVVRGQRALTFLLINFAIYITIYHIFGNAPAYLVGCGIFWSLINAIAMIHARQGGSWIELKEEDYQYWLLGNMIAIVANSYFVFLLPASSQLRFTMVMIYLSLQALLLKYQLAHHPEK